MKLTIIAATGVSAGNFSSRPSPRVTTSPRWYATQPSCPGRCAPSPTDLAAPDPAALESAIAGADAVLSGLGPHSNADAGIASAGTPAIVAAMQATGVRRIVAVSAAPVGTVPTPSNPSPPKHDPGDGFFMRHLLSHIANARLGKVLPTSRRWRTSWPERPGLDRRAAATADRQATHRHLPHGVRRRTSEAACPSPAPTSPTSCSA